MKTPFIGELDARVRLREWQDEPDADHGIDQTYDEGVEVWARIEPTGAALFYGMQQVEAGVTHRLVTWRSERINALTVAGSHVVDHYRTQTRFRVRRAVDMNGGQEFVLIDLEQLGKIP